MSSLTTTVRICFALARDGGFPASRFVTTVDPVRKIPDFAVLSGFITGSLLLLLQLWSSTAFVAVTSISTIGYQISYLIPIALRITASRHSFPSDTAFSLGRYSIIIGTISCLFLATTSLLFLLPTSFPITVSNWNYTPVVLFVVAFCCGVYWMVEGRLVFKGPQ